MKLLAFFAFALTFVTLNAQLPEGGSIWAVLVAGSTTWSNYRHQSDVCHAYQVLRNHGVPDEHIIVFMYDDIADNILNPTPGVIINHYNGSNVYEGVPKDYTKLEVNVQNFFNVLLGDEAAMEGVGSGKVLKSGPNDHVFINFVDHGSVNLVAFPYEEMYASDLQATLQAMYDTNMYGKLTFYMEACEAGSMFLTMPTNINIYATTASNAMESSYACYYDPLLQTYLGDLYSVSWMEDSDVKDLATYTLSNQYETVRDLTTSSHVMEYGDLTINALPVGEFQGLTALTKKPKSFRKVPKDAVPANEVHLEILKRKLEAAKTEAQASLIKKQIAHLLENRASLKMTTRKILQDSVHDSNKFAAAAFQEPMSNMNLEDRICYETTVKHFSRVCYPLSQNEYALRQLHVFANMCSMHISPATMMAAMDKNCVTPVTGIH